MKLYGSLASPFVARCWLTVAAKGGGADLEMFDGGIKSDSYLALNPMGKMRCWSTATRRFRNPE